MRDSPLRVLRPSENAVRLKWVQASGHARDQFQKRFDGASSEDALLVTTAWGRRCRRSGPPLMGVWWRVGTIVGRIGMGGAMPSTVVAGQGGLDANLRGSGWTSEDLSRQGFLA